MIWSTIFVTDALTSRLVKSISWGAFFDAFTFTSLWIQFKALCALDRAEATTSIGVEDLWVIALFSAGTLAGSLVQLEGSLALQRAYALAVVVDDKWWCAYDGAHTVAGFDIEKLGIVTVLFTHTAACGRIKCLRGRARFLALTFTSLSI